MGFRTYANASAGVTAAAAPARASTAGPGGWHPDVLYMLGLVIAEIIIAGFLSRHLLGE